VDFRLTFQVEEPHQFFLPVMPAKAGIQLWAVQQRRSCQRDSGLRRNDDIGVGRSKSAGSRTKDV
jgi:hypothetical protein